MTAEVIQLRDWDWLRPVGYPVTEPAAVINLPVVRKEHYGEATFMPALRSYRRSLLGDP